MMKGFAFATDSRTQPKLASTLPSADGKLYLHVDKDNGRAVSLYESCGFRTEGVLKDEFFVNGRCRDAVRMCQFQPDYLATRGAGEVAEPVLTGRRAMLPSSCFPFIVCS